jgi:hypothetical protein
MLSAQIWMESGNWAHFLRKREICPQVYIIVLNFLSIYLFCFFYFSGKLRWLLASNSYEHIQCQMCYYYQLQVIL